MRFLIATFCLFGALNSLAQNTLFLGGTAHIGDGSKIETSAIAIKDGKFEMVADARVIRIDPSAYDTIIHVYDQHVYPGFIATNTTLGITEISAVRATNDYQETGAFKPHVRSLIAFNAESKIIPTIRSNGVLMAQVAPKGGRITGTSSVMKLDGWNWEDAAQKVDDGIHLNWPSYFIQHGWWAEPGDIEKTDRYTEQTDAIHNYFQKALAYHQSSEKVIDLELSSMSGLFDGSKQLYVHANLVREMTDVMLFAAKYGLKNMVIVGGKEAHLVADLLVKHETPVILDRIHRLPNTSDADVDMPYKQAGLLHAAGVSISFCYQGDMEAMGQRNLPFSAGTAVAYGLPYEQAIAALTLNTAKMLGIEQETGSLEVGKEATFFISKGDALDMRGNDVQFAFIQGQAVDLDNHQKALDRKYRKKFGIAIKQ
ncbi:MAG: amidohydrolase [Flavobacteriales bacterium]|nr:amidohydrolase [Flavobacteriales bacterium]